VCSGLDCVAAPVVTAAGDWLGDKVSAFATWVGTKLIWASTWWMTGSTMDPNSNTVIHIQHVLLPISGLILMMAVLWQAGKMMISRKLTPLLDVLTGLVRYASISIAGLVFWEAVIRVSDSATGLILAATKQDFATKLGMEVSAFVAASAPATGAGSIIALLVVTLLLMLASLVQFVLAFVRLAGIQVLAVLLPLAAAGSLTESTRPWLRQVTRWMLTLVIYKPIAAAIYLLGFGLMVGPLSLPPGTPADMEPLSRTLIGMMVLVLAVFALPIMMKFFAPFGADGSGGGVAGAVLGGTAVAAGAVKLTGMMRGGAVSSAARLQSTGPSSGPPPNFGPPPLPPGGGSGPAGPTGSPGTPGPGGPRPAPIPGAGPGRTTHGPSASSASPQPSAPAGSGPASAGAAAGPAATGGGSAAGGIAGGAAAGAAAGPAGAAAAAGAAAHQVKQQAQGFGGQPPPTGATS
jgi:hypothetical protein